MPCWTDVSRRLHQTTHPPKPTIPPLSYPPQVKLGGLTVVVEFDGPNHFSIAPAVAADSYGGLFAAAPRRQLGDARLREALVRANRGWAVVTVPFFDW